VYGKVADFIQGIQTAVKLFKSALEMQLYSLADECANFIGGQEIKAKEIFDIYDLFVQRESIICLAFCLKSKVCAVWIYLNLNIVFVNFLVIARLPVQLIIAFFSTTRIQKI
jgi:hypothetical protein